MPTTERRRRPKAGEPERSMEPPSGLPLLHVLKQAKDHIERQPFPPQSVMLRDRHIKLHDFRAASRLLDLLISEQVAWEAVRRGAMDDQSYARLEKEVMAEVFTAEEAVQLHGPA